MTTVVEIEKAVQELPPEKLIEFRHWFSEWDHDIWDKEIELDAENGMFDKIASETLAEFKEGKCRKL